MIAVFDSGIGGLTILKSIMQKLPQYEYLYLADTARNPYGNHSKETLVTYVEQAVSYLFSRGATIIIFACFTATSTALREVQQKYLLDKKITDKKILGVLRPVIECGAKFTKNKKVGVIGTRATIDSLAFTKEMEKLDNKIKVYGKSCPLLVPLIEEQWQNKVETRRIIKYYLRDLKNQNIDTLIPGCTHYMFVYDIIKKIIGKRIKVIETDKIITGSLENYLLRHPEIEKQLSKKKKFELIGTERIENLKKIAENYLGIKVKNSNLINLDDY